MKQKVKFGRDSDESPIKDPAPISRSDRISLNSSPDVGFGKQTFGVAKKVTMQHDAEPCLATANLTIRLKIPKGTQAGEVDAEEDESLLPYMSMRATMFSHHGRKQECASMDPLDATCQIKGCTADLSCANGYFRRNKVCQEHFKAYKVEVGGFEQRFCQQCNRFQMLGEFDEDKRSCRLTLTGHNNRRKRSQPEATSVLSTGTLVYLPGKSKQGGKILRHLAASLACEDLERTITNEETSDSENNLRDDASSRFVSKEKSCHDLELANPISNQMKYIENIGKLKSQNLGHAHRRKEEALLEPMPNVSTTVSKSCSSKNSGSKKRSVSQHGHTNVCQVEGCMFDLSNTKDYFRRRKVCERHFKALKVTVQNVDQRFCQQCSRFHVLAEFDEGRKSCKRMLMGHNMRRRKGQSEAACRKTAKEASKEDYNSLKAPQSLSQIRKPFGNLGFEACREKTPTLTN